MKIPNLHHMPHEPEQWYKGCLESKKHINPEYEKELLQDIYVEDYCAKERFRELHIHIPKLIHTSIPALLPNQAVPVADFNFFNATPTAMPINIYHRHHPQDKLSRTKQNTNEHSETPLLPLQEVQRALDYFSKYGNPIPLDEDTLYAPTPNNTTTLKRKK